MTPHRELLLSCHRYKIREMSIASQLFQLQEIDTELESGEKTVSRITLQLGDNKVVTEAQSKLAAAHQRLQELNKQQRSLEMDIADITSKLTKVDKELYGGKVRNPKELTDLQHEAEGLKARRTPLEDKELEIMEQVETTAKSVASLESELKKVESEWQSNHKQLSADLEKLKAAIASLKEKRQLHVSGIDPQAVAVYGGVKKQRGTAVARVEQGLCRGCRISLPVTEFQKAKTGNLVRCGSCGRILYLA